MAVDLLALVIATYLEELEGLYIQAVDTLLHHEAHTAGGCAVADDILAVCAFNTGDADIVGNREAADICGVVVYVIVNQVGDVFDVADRQQRAA